MKNEINTKQNVSNKGDIAEKNCNILLKFNVDSPVVFVVTNSSLATQGDGEFGIWIEYKYLDFNTDF